MLVSTNTTASTPAGGTTFTNSTAVLVGGNTYIFPWVATARDNTIGTASGNVFNTADRTATTCYMRGLKERIQIQTNTGMPWQWRRICFTMKGDDINAWNETAYKLQQETSNGWARVVSNTGTASNLYTYMMPLLFKGAQGVDWNNPFNAKTDNSRLSIKYDKTTAIRCGNSNGMMKEYIRWHPMNKNLVYDDDENGEKEDEAIYSVDGKRGMGDYYVVDIIAAGSGSTSTDQLSFNPSATLYWHER